MASDSPLFDRIRVKPDKDRRLKAEHPACQWPGCTNAAPHRAPKGRGAENEYWLFCIAHVREYNQTYNYFSGMKDDEVASYQKDALTGHRPTWKMGMSGNSAKAAHKKRGKYKDYDNALDPFGMFREMGGAAGAKREKAAPAPERRQVRNAERKALDTMGLDPDAEKTDIKAKFKELVKRHHPDVNGGDRSTEDKLREIIQAYNYLKSVGFC
jgi:curved DNA-binding protein CbpA